MYARSRWRWLRRIKRATMPFFLSLLAKILSGDSYSLEKLLGSFKPRFMLRGSVGFQKLNLSMGGCFLGEMYGRYVAVTIHTTGLMRIPSSSLMVECVPALGLQVGQPW